MDDTAPQAQKMNFAGKKDQILPSCGPARSQFSFPFRALLYRSCYLLFCCFFFVFALNPDSHEQDIFSIRNRRTKRAPPFFILGFLFFWKRTHHCVHILHLTMQTKERKAFYIDVFEA